jgi:lipopolysaccharide/colanic/teichoic acid biosynthesis glycosyltransferase
VMKIKRIFDLFFTIPGLLVLSPLLVFAAVWIKLDSTGPVFFRQQRVGRYGRLFKIFKFRTMVADAEFKGLKITVGRDPRITRSGTFLRHYKLDELPQLFNIVKGEMSLVGPRPEVPEYVAAYPPAVRETVLSVPPGITDFASIEFKEENSILAGAGDPHLVYVQKILPVKLALYEKYVRERSIWLDFRLVLRTLGAIFSEP